MNKKLKYWKKEVVNVHLKPGHIIDVGEREGVVIINKNIDGHECVVISFDSQGKDVHEFYEVFERNGDITVKKITDQKLIEDMVVAVTDDALNDLSSNE